MAKTGADLLVERLLEWGVDTIFSLPGDGINGIYESLRNRQDKIKLIQVRHEEAAAFMACGYAKFTGKLGVCLATSGCGGIHLLNGLYDAKYDSQPVLAITGHTAHDVSGTFYQQDVDLVKVFADVAAYNERVMGPDHVVNVLDQAVRTSLGQRTVTHISFPKDYQEWTASDDTRSQPNVPNHSSATRVSHNVVPDTHELHRAAELINAGEKVVIFAGRGCLDARDEVLALSDAVGGPIIKALLGKGVVPDTDPHTTGGLGLLGTAPSQDAMQECDTLIMIGTRFPYLEYFPKPGQARTVQIDIDPSHIGLRTPVEIGLLGSSKAVLQALLPLIKRKDDQSFLEKSQQRMTHWNELLTERATQDVMPMKPQVVPHIISPLLNDDAIVTCDCGNNTTWAARHIQLRGTMQFSTSGLLATMASGLPYAIAASVAHPGKQVVALVGDGGFTMLMGELATAVKYKLPIKVFIFHNNSYGQIKWEQIVMEGNPEFAVDLHSIDFAAYARACGATGFTIDDPKNADAIIRQAMAYEGPVVVDAIVDANEPPMPGKITTDQAIEFAKALVRGEKDRSEIIKNVITDQFNEAVATKGRSLLNVIPGLG
ncbi:thiamine pyrophosphate-dependent enzyme [Spirosoma linguale]|uniref:Thiamine pyrophosphate protein domain protein TPP-binding protein n=1 Tax=Spirosoma linguale (strain ATCC 33905 / DSM 74 / LMG 10896 / Claus 1) TaxID=504472 RepID=D2QU46_SPILD|nr:thiamine pyrophosphate protein domain protein TPP-binding protein [Spirosoma linguale DSM 74]